MSIENMAAAVVKIHTATGSGSGFYLKERNLVVTNFHVVEGARKAGIKTQAQEDLVARVALVNPMIDIAFLQPERPLDLPGLQLRKTETLKAQDKVSVLGFPLGMPFTVTEGVVSSTRQVVNGRAYIQTDAAINPGNSGGPMVDARGEVIGVSTAKITEADNIGFALPIDLVIEELEGYREGQEEMAAKCPACGTILAERVEYCPNCGAKLDVEALFPEERISPFALLIEEALKKLGVDPVIARNGPNFWEFYQGSAMLRWFIYKNNYFYATSPLCKLPKTGLEELYRLILSDSAAPYKLGIYQDIVYLSYRVAMCDIKGEAAAAVQERLAGLALKADEMDNQLIEKFQCPPIPKGEA
jgi:serine protease Do